MKHTAIRNFVGKLIIEAIKFFAFCCVFMVIMSICGAIENMKPVLLLAAIAWLLLANFALGIYYDVRQKTVKVSTKKEASHDVH